MNKVQRSFTLPVEGHIYKLDINITNEIIITKCVHSDSCFNASCEMKRYEESIARGVMGY